MAGNTVRSIGIFILNALPMEGVMEGTGYGQTMTCHSFLILMAGHTQFHHFSRGTALMQAVGKVIVKGSGPLVFSVASQTAVQDFLGDTPFLFGQTTNRLVNAIFMAIGTLGEIICMLFEHSLGILSSMHTEFILINHSGMGEILFGCGIHKVAGSSTINFFCIAMGIFTNIGVAFLTANFPVNRLRIQFFINVIEMLLARLINSSQT